MKIQNYAVVFIIIIMPIAMVLSIYTGNLIDVANKQASYDSILLNSTYDAIKTYQVNTLNNDYESENNSKVRDINASVNSFFNSLAMGFSSSRLGKEELKTYIPAILYTLYDGYYVYGTYDNIVNTVGGVSYNENAQVNKKEYGLKPYVYYSCEYQGTTDNNVEYDIIVNYTLDNYITVTGKFGNMYISRSGYYIDYNKVEVPVNGTEPVSFDKKIVTLYPGSDNEVKIGPEELGEYLITIDLYRNKEKPTETDYRVSQQEGEQDPNAKYYNYIIYNNVKYYLDDELVNADGTAKQAERINEMNISHNATYDGIPIFYLDRDTRTYISQSTLNELKSYLGVENDSELYTKQKYKDVNAYYYYFKSTQFSMDVYPVLKDINLGKTTITNTETGEEQDVIISNLPYDENGNIVDSNGQVHTGNVIKTETYHTKYTYQNGVESHVKSTYDTSKVFNFDDEENNPELESSSFNRHRMDVIISSIESSLVSSMASFNSYIGATYDYRMPVLKESEWDRICNNITMATFMQGLTIGNYKYYSNYSIVANTKVKDFIPKDSIYVQNANLDEAKNGEYHNPRCIDYNKEISTNPQNIVGYRNIDYDRQNCKALNFNETTNADYWYYLQPGTGAYGCIVGQNNNIYTTDELLKGIKDDGSASDVNGEIRRAYITALAREKGNSYKTYGFLNQELQQKNPLTEGEALYTVHYYYQDYDYENGVAINNSYKEMGNPFSSTALVGTPITSLTLHTTPRKGYKYKGNNYIEITRNAPEDGNWTLLGNLSNEDRVLKKGSTTHIALYFDVDTSKTKTLNYNVEFYLWNSGTLKYDYKGTKIYPEGSNNQIWINDDNNVKVYIPNPIPAEYSNSREKLAYTDPPEYAEGGHAIETGSLIKAYYSNNPELIGKTYTIRYHANGGSGTMGNQTCRFLESIPLDFNAFTKEGSTFEGWALSENGEVVYKDHDAIVYGDTSRLTQERKQILSRFICKMEGNRI